jgi:putative Mn2+ efflux pump MntP
MNVLPVATSLTLAFSLSMDSFAAALGAGATLRRPCVPEAVRVGAAFGICQLAMPVVGWAIGVAFASMVASVDHWIAFGLLFLVGGAMIWNYFQADEESDDRIPRSGLLTLFTTGLATSIDASAVGVGLAMVDVAIVTTALLIGAVTFGVSFSGVLLGRAVGPLLGRWAELAGGVGLIVVGTKILIEHTMS